MKQTKTKIKIDHSITTLFIILRQTSHNTIWDTNKKCYIVLDLFESFEYLVLNDIFLNAWQRFLNFPYFLIFDFEFNLAVIGIVNIMRSAALILSFSLSPSSIICLKKVRQMFITKVRQKCFKLYIDFFYMKYML